MHLAHPADSAHVVANRGVQLLDVFRLDHVVRQRQVVQLVGRQKDEVQAQRAGGAAFERCAAVLRT